MVCYHLYNIDNTLTACQWREFYEYLSGSTHTPAHKQTRPAAHIGRPRFAQPHRTKKLCTSSESSEDGHICRTKNQSQCPKPRRELLVEGLKIDVVQQGGRRRDFEIDLSRLTCKQGWGNEQGCMLGMHGDELGGPELVSHAYLMIWSLCMAGRRNLGGTPLPARLVAQSKS